MTPEELLKEVGEPGTWEFRTYNAETDEVIYHVTQSWLEAKHYDQFPMPLYTSDQVAAAILKATGPLEEEIDRLESESEEYAQLQSRCFDGGGSHASVFDEVSELRAQLTKAEQRITELENDRDMWKRAFENGGTETMQKQLARAEQRVAEWQPISTAPITCNSLLIRRNGEVCIANWGDYDEVNQPKFTHWMPLPKAPANGASS